jgi:hypothetical protein
MPVFAMNRVLCRWVIRQTRVRLNSNPLCGLLAAYPWPRYTAHWLSSYG